MILKKILSVFGLVVLGGCFCLNAQTTAAEKTVYGFFSKPKKIQWVEHYKGQIDGVNDIAITLAYNGKSCKGLLVYLKSGERLRLDGILNSNEIKLLEIDQNGVVSGEFEGYIHGKNMLLNWSNIDNTLGSELFLTQIPKDDLSSKQPIGNPKWVRHYEGVIFGENVDLFLQHDGQNELKGIAYFENENKSYKLIGKIFDFDKLNIAIRNDQNKLRGDLQGVFKSINEISANYYIDGQRTPTIFITKHSLNIDCIEYADYFSNYDIAFPKTSNISFNRWMKKLTSQWLDDCRKHSFEVRTVNADTKPNLRSSVRAYAWSEVDFFDENLISGFLTFESTWTLGMNGKPFNFDFKKGKEITLEDLFKEGLDHSVLVANQLNKKIDEHKLYSDFEFRKWLSEQDFSYFLIHKDGLAFCTSFNSIYGRQKVKIPYSELKPYLKENNVLQYLID